MDDRPSDKNNTDRRATGYGKCALCSAPIKFQRTEDGKLYAAIPGTTMKHRCRSSEYQSNQKQDYL